MTIQQFIEKAIEGGWRTNIRAKNYPVELALRVARATTYSKEKVASFLLDPASWRAVGKVEGWGKEFYIGQEVAIAPTDLIGRITSIEPTIARVQVEGVGLQKVPREVIHGLEWKEAMHRMIDALADGKTIEQYLETL